VGTLALRPGPVDAQRYMHLSPAATEDAIRLLDGRQSVVELAENFGDILETREVSGEKYVRGKDLVERATGIEPV
jgi:hypothetical protein